MRFSVRPVPAADELVRLIHGGASRGVQSEDSHNLAIERSRFSPIRIVRERIFENGCRLKLPLYIKHVDGYTDKRQVNCELSNLPWLRIKSNRASYSMHA